MLYFNKKYKLYMNNLNNIIYINIAKVNNIIFYLHIRFIEKIVMKYSE